VGVVQHDQLKQYVKEVDGFIMPFYVTDLITSVDPVKLYEYINFNKNILCVKYDEINRFERYVFFYSDYKSYISQIKIMMQSNDDIKYSEEDRINFLHENTWENRVEQIIGVLKE
jgi:hypothetical protein